MNFNFELILFYAVVVCGVIDLFDRLFLAKKRKLAYEAKNQGAAQPAEMKLPIIIEYAKSFFPILLVVFLLRSFLYEPFRIPTSSLEPTLLVGDFILVNKYDYGVRLPVLHDKIIKNNEPQRGDIIVFRWPPNPSVDFIKRVIGVPGDHISYIDKVLSVNGQKVPQDLVNFTSRIDEEGQQQEVALKEENLLGVKHTIYQNKNQPSEDFTDIVVPKGMYFVMGDNRDDSADSRFWGFVPEANIVGKAVAIWMSWDKSDYKVRWNRLIKPIH
jgi:signal peptidase I